MKVEEPDFPIVVGRCIYCRADAVSLTDEHIIPFGLNGEWVLKDASCKTCARVTSALEKEILRGEFWPLRTRLGMKTRREKERPKHLDFRYRIGGVAHAESLPVEESPVSVGMPRFGVPGHLDTDDVGRSSLVVEGLGALQPSVELLKKVASRVRAEEYTISSPDPETIARFVAKVGFGFAVACVGLDTIVDPWVVGSILHRDGGIGQWVGSLPDEPRNPGNGLHAVTLERRSAELWAHVRLFAQFSFPEYVVVLGSTAQHRQA
jgi:hypothetical protein